MLVLHVLVQLGLLTWQRMASEIEIALDMIHTYEPTMTDDATLHG